MAGARSRFDIKVVLAALRGLVLGGRGTVVGLSIGTSSIKLIELARAGSGWKLLHFGIFNLQEEAIVNREIVNQLAVTEGLKMLVNQLKLRTKTVCTSLSGTSLIVKRMTIEAPNIKELQEQVFWEAEQYIPFDIGEVVMDYQVLSRSKDAKTDVLLVAVKRNVLDNYISCVEEAGLNPKVVDVDFFALGNLFEASYPSNQHEAVMLAEIGASATRIVVVHNGIPLFTKDASLGGQNLTAEIMKRLGLSFRDAETLKTGGSAGLPQEVSELMHVMSENLATEIKRSIDFYNASSLGPPVASILLSGGGAKIEGFSRVVEETTKLPAQMINPFNLISYDPSVFTQDYVSAIAPIAAVPIGLAIRAGVK